MVQKINSLISENPPCYREIESEKGAQYESEQGKFHPVTHLLGLHHS